MTHTDERKYGPLIVLLYGDGGAMFKVQMNGDVVSLKIYVDDVVRAEMTAPTSDLAEVVRSLANSPEIMESGVV